MPRIETRPFGRTGHESTRVLFGAAALGSVSQEDADRTMELLIEYGVNHLDVAASYGKGEAEKRLGPWMEKRRGEFFLATKTGERSYEAAKRELRESLERLRVDNVDLIQLHNLTDPEGWETAMGSAGAFQALLEAKDEGLVRFIGVTGHGMQAPDMHIRSLGRYRFDSVLLPYNHLMTRDKAYAEAFDRLVKTCKDKGAAVQTIKSIARRPWDGERFATTWYEPLQELPDIRKAVSWVLGNEAVFLNSAGDIKTLPAVLEAAASPLPRPSDEEMEQLVEARGMEGIFEGSEALGPNRQR